MGGTTSLKALATKVLERNPQRNAGGTEPQNSGTRGGTEAWNNGTPTERSGGAPEGVEKDFSGKDWDSETAALVEWFERTPAPAQPFRLAPGVFVARPAHFWDALRRDIAAGPSGPRSRTGALREDLLKLAALFKGRP